MVTFRAKEPANRTEQGATIRLDSSFPRSSEAVYKGASVLRNLVPAELTILKPTVDILLGLDTGDGQTRFANFGGFAFTRGEEFSVIVLVEPNGQGVSSVDALLDFDPETLEVLGIARTGDILLDQVTVSRFDNAAGTIEFSAVTTTGIFSTGDIAVVTFRTRQATQSLNVGFHEEFPRGTKAAFQSASVLRNLLGFPVEISLKPRFTEVVGGFSVDVDVVVRPNGNRVAALNAFLDIINTGTGDLQVNGISAVTEPRLEFVLAAGTSDGSVNFNAITLRVPPTTEFDLATVNMAFTGIPSSLADVSMLFHREFPRKTDAAFRGVPAVNLRLVDLVSLELLLPGAPENLGPLDSIFDATFNTQTPTFLWDPPLRRPTAGIRTFNVGITNVGITGPVNVSGNVDEVQFGTLECFDALGNSIGTGGGCFTPETGDKAAIFRFRAAQQLLDGNYSISVKAIDNLNQVGEPAQLAFSIDRVPPAAPALVSPDDDPARPSFVNTSTPTFDWNASTGDNPSDRDPFGYQVLVTSGDILVGPFDIDAVITGDTTDFQAIGNLADGRYQWRVIARDKALNTASSVVRTLTVDTLAPGVPLLVSPEDLLAPRQGFLNTNTPFFDWDEAPSTGDVFDYLLQVVRSGDDINSGPFALDVEVDHPSTEFRAVDALPDATYQWRVIAQDLALNTASSVVRSFVVDTLRPAAPALVAPPDRPAAGAFINKRDITFSWSPSASSGDVLDYLFQVTSGDITRGPFDAERVLLHPDTETLVTLNVDGVYRWRVISRDRALNAGTSDVRSFRLDTTAPGRPPLVVPANAPARGSFLNTATPFFDWDASDGDEPGNPAVENYLLQVTSGDIDTGPYDIETALGRFFTFFRTEDALAEGGYRWRVVARDRSLNVNTSDIQTFTVDITRPDLPALVAPLQDAFDNTGTPLFNWSPARVQTATGDGVRTEFALTGDPVDGDLDGVLTSADVIVEHPIGNILTTADYSVDHTGDTVTFVVAPVTGDGANIRFTFLIADNAADVFDYRLQVTFSSGDIADGPFDIDVVVTGDPLPTQFQVPSDQPLRDSGRTYQWRVIARDKAFNETQSRTQVFVVDTVPPGTADLISPADAPDRASFLNTSTPLFDWEESFGEVLLYLLQVTRGDINTGPFDISTAVLHPVTQFQVPTGDALNDDVYRWRVTAIDRALNLTIPLTRTFTVDTLAPAAPALVTPSDLGTGDPVREAFLNTSTPAFDWNASTGSQPSDSDVFDYRLLVTSGDIDTGPFDIDTVISGDLTQFTVPVVDSLADGLYRWRVIARDGAFNATSTVGRSFIIDTLAPTQPSLVAPGDGAFLNDNIPIFDWSSGPFGAAPLGNDFDYLLQVTSGDIILGPYDINEAVFNPVTQFQTGDALNDSIYRWRVIARDRALNVATSDTRTFKVDTVNPDTPTGLTQTGNVEALRSEFQWNRSVDLAPVPPGSGDGSGVDFYRVLITGPDVVVATADDSDIVCPAGLCRFTTPVDLTPGAYTVEVKAVDRAGNESLAASTGSRAGPKGVVQSLKIVAPVFDTTVNTANPTFTWIRPLEEPEGGLLTYQVAITGDFGGQSPFTIIQPIRLTGDATFFDRFFVECSGSVTGNGVICGNAIVAGDVITITVIGVDGGGTVVLDGTHILRVQVVSGFGIAGTPVDLVFTVDTTPPGAPVLVSPEDTPARPSFINTTTPLFDWEASDGDPFGYRLQVTTGGINIDTGPVLIDVVFTGDITQFQVPTGDALANAGQAYQWRVIARDRALNINTSDISTFTVDVVAPAAPALVAPADVPARESFLNTSTPFFDWNESPTTGDLEDYLLQVVRSGDDLVTGPFAINEVITGSSTQFQSIQNLADGRYQWRVIARDKALNTGASSTGTFTVDIVAPGVPPLVAPADAPARESFLNSRTPFLEWTPSTGDVFDYRLQVTRGDINVGPFDVDVVVAHPTTVFQVPTGDALLDGVYQWRVIARDLALNPATSDTRTFTVDTVAPGAPALTAPADAPLRASFLKTNRPFFDWQASTGDVFDYRLRVRSGDINTGPVVLDVVITGDTTEFLALQNLADGRYQWRVIARDLAFNAGTSDTRTFTVDTVVPGAPPLTAPADAPARASFLKTSTPFFDWNESPTTGDLEDYLLRVTSGDIDTGQLVLELVITGDTTEFQTTGDLVDARYQWRVIARDKALNTASSVVRTFTVDTVAPGAPAPETLVVSPIVTGDLLATSKPLFDWDESPTTGDVEDYLLRVVVSGDDIDTGPVALEAVVQHPTTQFRGTGDLADATYQWRIIARDKAFNAATSDAPRTFTVDTTPPAAPVLVLPIDAPARASFLNTRTPLFDWLASTSTADVFGYRLQVARTRTELGVGSLVIDVVITGDTTQFLVVPRASVITGDPILQVVVSDSLADGRYVWRVIARDEARNPATSDTRTLTVDTQLPGVVLLVAPADNERLRARNPLFQWQPTRLDVFDYIVRVTSGDINTGPFDVDVVVLHPTLAFRAKVDLPDGTYQWTVTSRDRALNTILSVPRTFIVDTVPPGVPDLVVPADGAFLNTSTPTLRWATGDADDYLLQAVVSGDDLVRGPFAINVVIPGNTTAFQVLAGDALADAEYRWRVVARDQALNTASSVTRTFTVDTVAPGVPPLVSPAQGAFLNIGGVFFDWTASAGVVFDYRLLVTSGDIVFGPFDIDEVLPGATTQFQVLAGNLLNDAIYQWRVVARDRALNTASSATRAFVVDTLAPTTVENLQDVSINPDAEVRTFQWDRSIDPVPSTGTGCDESGVDFYNIQITGPVTVVATADDSEAECPGGLCNFITPELVPGNYTISVNVVDRAANTSDFVTLDFRAGPPGVVRNLRLVDPVFGNTVATSDPAFRWSPPELDADVQLITYEVAITGGLSTLPATSDLRIFTPFTGDNFFAECFNATGDSIGTREQCINVPQTGDVQITVTGDVPDGTHTLRVRGITIRSGGSAQPSLVVELTFTVDTTPPGAPALVFPSTGDFINDNTPLIDWVQSGDVFSYRLLVSSGDVVSGPFDIDALITGDPLVTQFQVPTGDSLADNLYQWRVIASDRALNTASSLIQPFTVDTVPPGAPTGQAVSPLVVSPAVTGDLVATKTVFFKWTPSTGDVFAYRLQATRGNIATGPFDVNQEIEHPFTGDLVTLPADGTYQWRVIARDRAFNPATSVTRSFTVDTTPPGRPALVLPPNKAFLDVSPAFLSWQASTGDVFQYRLRVTSRDIDTGPFDIDALLTGDPPATRFSLTQALGDGSYKWRVIASDRAGNRATSRTTDTFTLDTTPPGKPPLVSPADKAFTNNSRPIFDWDASTGDVVGYLLQVLKSGNSFATGPFELEVPLSAANTEFTSRKTLAEGAYRWRVIARERRNIAVSEVRSFTVDTVRPQPPAGLEAPIGVTNDSTPLFDWDASPSSDVARYRLQVVVSGDNLDTGPFAVDVVISSGDPLNTRFQPATLLADASYQWRVVAGDRVISGDRALNTASSVTRTFTVDVTAPTAPSQLTELTLGDETLEKFTWVRSVDLTSGVESYNVVITGPVNITETTGDSFCDPATNLCTFVTPDLIPGRYTLRVTAVDRAANESLPAILEFQSGPRSAVQNLRVTGDLVTPLFVDPVTVTPLSGGPTVNTGNVQFRWAAPPTEDLPDSGDALQGGIATYEVAITGVFAFRPFTGDDLFVQCFNPGGLFGEGDICIGAINPDEEIQLTVTGQVIPDGTHVLRVRIVDRKLGALQPVDVTFTVDKTPPAAPELVSPALGDFVNTRTPSFDWNSSLDVLDVFDYRLLVTSGDIDTGPFDVDVVVLHPVSQFQLLKALTADGTYNWRVIAGDRALNTASSLTRSFTVDTVAPQPPLLIAPTDVLLLGTGEVPFEWRTGDADVDTFDFRLQVVVSGDDLSSGPFVIDQVISGTRFTGDLPDDIYRWRVLSRDKALNTASSATRIFTVDATAPVPPVPTAPIGLIKNPAPLFRWAGSTSKDIFSYRLQVVRSGDNPIIDVLITGDPPANQFQVVKGIALPNGLPDATYQWKLIAGDRAANTSSSVTGVFTVDTTPPARPTELRELTVGIERIEIFTWNRSQDVVPTTGTTGDESGVDFYKVVITGPQGLIRTADDSEAVCPGGVCEFSTAPIELIPANYNIAVSAVDLAGNVSAPVTADFRAGPLVVVQNLRVESPLFVDVDPRDPGLPVLGATVNTGEPVFRWTRSEDLPESENPLLAIVDYEVVITGDPVLAPNFRIPATGGSFVSFASGDFFITECFGADNNFIGAGKVCTTAVETGDEIRIKIVNDLDSPIPDGTHILAVRVIGAGDIPPFELVNISFTVDRTAPDVETPAKTVLDDDDTPVFAWTIVDLHSEEVVFQRVHIESQTFIDITIPDAPTLVSPEDDVFRPDVRTFIWNKANDDISDERGLTYTLEVDFVTGDFSNPVVFQFGITGDANGAQFTLPQGVSLASGDFVWRVRAVDRAGNIGNFTELRRFDLGVDTDPPGQPTLIVPALEIVLDDITPEFAWTQVTDDISGVKSYTIHIATADINTPFFSKAGISQPADPTDNVVVVLGLLEALPFDNFTWRVEAFDRAGNSRFSIPSTFEIVADNSPPDRPVLLSPSNVSTGTDTTPIFTWTAVIDLPAGKEVTYRLEIASAGVLSGDQILTGDQIPTGDQVLTGDFDNPVFTADGIKAPALPLPQGKALNTGDFIWRVQATDIAGNVGIFSVPFTFQVVQDVVLPGSPSNLRVSPLKTADEVEDPTPTFSWNRVTDDSGVTYTIEIANAGVVSGDLILTGDQIPPVSGDDLNTGDFNNPVFTGDVPQPLGTGDVQFTLPDENALTTTGGYFWRVRAVDGAGNVGPFSAFSTSDLFRIVDDTTKPGVPSLISPRNLSAGSNSTPTFTWTRAEDLSGVERYTLELALAAVVSGDQILTGDQIPPGVPLDAGDFDNPIFTADLPEAPEIADRVRFTLGSGGALATGDYVWHVRAIDNKANTGDFSLPFFFTLTTTADAPALATVLIAPADGSTGDDKTPTFIWRPVTGDLSPVTYTLELAPAVIGILSGDQVLTGDQVPTGDQVQTGDLFVTGDFGNLVFTADIAEPVDTGDVQITLPGQNALATGDFFWRVSAADVAGNTGDFGGPFGFTVLEDVTPPGKPLLEQPGSTTGDRKQGNEFIDHNEQPTPVFRWRAVADPSGVVYELEIATATRDILTGAIAGDFSNVVFTADGVLATVFAVPADKALTPNTPTQGYIWHVRAADGFGNTGDFSDPFVFAVLADTEPPTVPVLLSPASGDIVETARPTFQWSQSTDPSAPVTYLLQVSTTGDFSILDSLVITGGLEETSFKPKVQLPGGTFFWHVVAADDAFNPNIGGPNTADSGTKTFKVVGTPDGLTVEPFFSGPGTDDYVPTLRWRAVPEAVSYEISVDGGPFRDIGTGDPGAPAGEVRFELKKPLAPPALAPVLVSPLGGTSTDDTTPTFTWRPVTGDLSPVTYTLQIDNATGDFTAPILSTGNIPEPALVTEDVVITLSQVQALPAGDYIWRVVAQDEAGNTGDSVSSSLKVVEDTTAPAVPALLIPVDGATGGNTTPTFVWNRVSDSSGVSYTFEITTGGLPATGTFVNPAFTTGGFITPIFTGDVPDGQITADRVEFTLPQVLVNGDYFWHVRAVDGTGKTGDFSIGFGFTVTGGAASPALVTQLNTPADTATVVALGLTFEWSPVTGDLSPVSYTLEIGTADFTNLVLTADAIKVTSFTLPEPSGLATGGHIWRVIARDGASNVGTSDSRTFTVVEAPSGVPTLIAPRDASAGGNITPAFTWTRVTGPGAVTYTLQILAAIVSGDGLVTGDFDNPVFTADLPEGPATADRIGFTWSVTGDALSIGGSLATADALATGDYFWRVRANTGDFSGPFTFTVKGSFVADPITFGPHHLFQVRAVVTGSTLRGGISSLFFSDNVVAPGGAATPAAPLASGLTVPEEDFLPLGEHIIQISGLDRLDNTGKLEDAQLLFKVARLEISLQPDDQTVVEPGQTAKVTVQIDPQLQPVDGAEISIDFDTRLAFVGITTGGGVTVTDIRFGPSTADFKASFDALTGTEDPLTLATIEFNTFGPFRPTERNVVFVNTGDRKTVGRFENRDVQAVLEDATLAVNTPPTAVAAGPTAVVIIGQAAAFDGTASSDPDGSIVSFTWSFGDGGAGFGSATNHAYFLTGVFPVILTVTDNDGASRTAALTVTVESGALNFAPNANAGADQTVNEGVNVNLNATGTSDPNPEDAIGTLTFSWVQTSGPPVVLASTSTPSFFAADNGTFSLYLGLGV